MAKKRKGELPSGNVRRQIYNGMKQKIDKKTGLPVFDEKGNPVMIRDYISVTASDPREAELKKSQLKVDLSESKSGKHTKKNITLYDAISEYIESRTILGKSPTTIQDYKVIQQYAFQDIMQLSIWDLDEEILQDAVNMESKRPVLRRTKTPKPISTKRLRNEWGLISSVLKKHGTNINLSSIELPVNVERVVELPPAGKVINIVKGSEIELAVLLAAWLSFSLSEIRGLTKSKSISEDGNYIRINEVIVDVDNKPVVKQMAKNPTRNRKHRIPEYIKELINKVESDYLVPMTGFKIYKDWIKIQKANGMTPITFHDLRHLNASVMAILHIPDKYAQERGGWKTDNTMKKVYTQTFADERVKVDDKMDSFFNNLVYDNSNIDTNKYHSFLKMFNLNDDENAKNIFIQLQRQNK